MSGYTERDMARLAVAQRAVALADRVYPLVGRYGHDVSPQEWLRTLVAPVLDDARELQAAVVAYARSQGLGWAEVAEATGLDEAQARQRWGAVAVPEPDTGTDELVASLEYWYIRHMWLDPASAVPDPLRQLLDRTSGNTMPSCLICRKYAGGPVPVWVGRPVPPGGHLVDDDLWWVGAAPPAFTPSGSVLIESRRHYLDYADMTPAEATSYAELLTRLTPVIKQVTGAERIHVFSSMDGAPHFHAWMVPRRPGDRPGRTFMGNPGYTSEAEADELINRMRELLAKG